MEIGLGLLSMTPDAFWGLTVPEFNAKLKGWMDFNCAKSASDGPSATEAEEMREDVLDLLERFPDGELPDHVRRKHKRNKAAGMTAEDKALLEKRLDQWQTKQ